MATSPVGGTTSLPEYLQKRKPATGVSLTNPTQGSGMIGGMTRPATQPAVGPGSQPPRNMTDALGGPQPSQPQVGTAVPHDPNAGLPKPIIPPPPPPPAAAVPTGGVVNPSGTPGGTTGSNVAPAPGQTGQAAPGAPISMGNFRGVLEQILGQAVGGQGRYGNDLVERMRESMNQRNTDLRKAEEQNAIADAAKRGVYYGTPLTNSLGDISERFLQRQTQGETDLLQRIADAQAMDQQSAIGNIFGFGQGELAANNASLNQQIALAQLGMFGGPTIPGAMGDFNSLPGPQSPDMTEYYKYLGSIWGGQPPKNTTTTG